MKVGFIAYSDMTEIELVAPHECLSKVAQFGVAGAPECHVIGVTEEVVGWNGLVLRPHHHYRHVDLAAYDLLVVPGGLTSRTIRYDESFMAWLGGWDLGAKTIASACSGALILGEAGFLRGRRATTHMLAMEALRPYCREVVKERVVEDGPVITSGGIMAAFDLGLHLVGKFWGPEIRRAVAHQDEYRDVEAATPALKATLDVWYAGGHRKASLRPANWVAPPPDDLIDRTTTDYEQAPPPRRSSVP